MDGLQLSDLSGLISRLNENPAALNALGSLLGNLNQPQKKEPARNESDDLMGMLGSLGSLMNNGIGSGNSHSGEPFSAEDRSERFSEKKDTGIPNRITNIFGTREEIKNRILLLNALRPYLSESRRERLEMVIKFLKLTELGELGALLNRP